MKSIAQILKFKFFNFDFFFLLLLHIIIKKTAPILSSQLN